MRVHAGTKEEKQMYTVVRIYEGAPALADTLASRADDVRGLLKGVDGFETYQLVRTYNGALSVTTCRDKQGTDESNRIAADYLRANLPHLVTSPPTVIQGENVLTFGLAPASV